MVDLVTAEEAKRHLRIEFDDDDTDLDLKISAASEIVVDYIKRPDHGWTAETAPFLIKAAVLLMVTDLYAHRGDGDPVYAPADGYLPQPVTAILHRFRDPAYA